MASELLFYIPGLAVPWARAGKRGKLHFTRPAQAAYMKEIALRAAAAMATQEMMPFVGPVTLDIRITIPIPSTFTKSQRASAMSGGQPALTGPDWDNLGKIVADALNGVAYHDDRQIARGTVAKFYGPNPHSRVILNEWVHSPNQA